MSSCCAVVQGQFDESHVAGELERYRDKGPGRTARKLIEALLPVGVVGSRLLDIGAGLGEIQIALFERGLTDALHVEISEAYSAAAREVARERGYDDRVDFRVGDFAELADDIPEADVVTLDRAICCYDDMPALLEPAVARTGRVLALSAPRTMWPVRLVIGLENVARRLKGDPFRTYVHSWSEMDRRIRTGGLERVTTGGSFVWRISVYRRPARAG